MKELNRNKSKNGNAFQNKLYEEYVSTYAGAAYFKNNNSYYVEGIGKKISDVEMELASHPKIRIIFEATTSLRDDRYWAKEVQAKLIKNSIKEMGKRCIYVLVVPDDTYYDINSKEPENNKHFESIVNSGVAKTSGVGGIDLFVRESEIYNLIRCIDNDKYQMPNRIINNYKMNKI